MKTISLTCPHCGCLLDVDIEAGVVVRHHPPRPERKALDFDERLKALQDDKQRAADRMDEAMRQEKAKEKVLEERFRRLLEEAPSEDEAERPLKDIDLD